MKRLKFILSMFIVLSLFIMGGNGIQAETNIPPVADAGSDICITTDEFATTIIQGYITDANEGDSLACLWEDENGNQLTPLMDVGLTGQCPLDLSTTYTLGSVGVYTLTVIGTDWTVVTQDSMILTIVDVDANCAPVGDAGPDISITTDEFATTIILGLITDVNEGDSLACLWEDENGNQLTPLMDVGLNGQCPLDLSTTYTLGSVGVYTLTVIGTDWTVATQDSMILTIVEVDPNAAPDANAGPNITISYEKIATTIIQGYATDPDGDPLSCVWKEGTNILLETSAGPNGECPLDLNTLLIDIGTYNLFLIVDASYSSGRRGKLRDQY
jgi:hypothetical protein